MVRRVFSLVYREVRGLHQAAYVLALFAFGSQLLALLRDRMLAHEFGAGADLDIYYTAFKIPDLLFVLFASTLSVYVLIPFVAKARLDSGDDTKAQHLLSQVFSIFLVVYSGVAALAWLFAPMLVPIFFPGIEDTDTLVSLMRILLLQPLFLGISSLFGVVTQLGHRFVLYAISPLIYNVGIIFGIAVLYPIFGLQGLALGVVLGAFGHMLIQLPLVQSSSLSFGFARSFAWRELATVFVTSVPRALTLSVNQFVLLILIGFASVMTVGSVSVFQFAYNLQSVPLAVIGVSYSVAAFPILAELFAAKDMEKFRTHILTALRHIIFWSVPAIALIIVLRAQIVRVVLGSGAFDWNDTRLVAATLAILSLALVAHAINLLVVRAFYAGGNTRTPFFVSLFGAILAVSGAVGFYVWYLSHAPIQQTVAHLMRLNDVAGTEVLALSFGYTLAVIIQSLIFLFAITREHGIPFRGMIRHSIVSFAAAAVGGISAYGTLNFIVVGINPDTFIGIMLQGFIAGVVGVTGVILTYAGFRSPELTEVYLSFHKRLFKTDVIAPAEDVI